MTNTLNKTRMAHTVAWAFCALVAAGAMTAARAELTRVTPESGLQAALDAASPGDILSLAPGTYYERVIVKKGGAPGKPLVIRAEAPGTAILSGADPAWDRRQPEFELIGEPEVGVYQTPVPYPVWAAMSDGRVLRRCESLHELSYDSPHAGPRASWLNEGFFWENGIFYLRARDPKQPGRIQILRESKLDIALKPIRNGHFLQTRAIYLMSDADYVTIEGLRIFMGGNVGIEMLPDFENARMPDHITIRDCLFSGCAQGIVSTWGGTCTQDLLVEYCEYGFWPSWGWAWNGSYDAARFMIPAGDNMTIRHNIVHDTFDPFQFRSPWVPGGYKPPRIDVHHNLLYRIKDDAFELEYVAPMFVRVHHNIVEKQTRPDIPPLLLPADGLNDLGHRVQGKAPDIGAIELGDEWLFPRPGPRWFDPETTEPARPPFPAGFNMSLAGFASGHGD